MRYRDKLNRKAVYMMYRKRQINQLSKVAGEVLGFHEKPTLNKWFNEECRTSMLERDDARKTTLRNPREGNR